MTPELKATWVATLRSGNYKQGLGRLRNDQDEVCCLGVLCDIVRPGAWCIRNTYGGMTWHNGRQDLYPCADFQEEVGLADEECRELGSMNDKGTPFSAIADYIEEHL